MLTVDQVQQLSQLLPNAQTIVIGLPGAATFDHLAAGTSLLLALQAQGKEVQLVMPGDPRPDVSMLVGQEQIKQQLGNKDLQIGFEYSPEKVDKVSYHIDEDQQRFYLVIKPRVGQKPLDVAKVEMEYVGAEADLIILIGIHDFEMLEHLYSEYTQLYQDTTVVTLHTFETPIGLIKLDASGLSCISEAVAQLIQSLDLPMSSDNATNLLAGIEEVTQGFRSLATTADTFEIVARLMRSGARRLKKPSPPMTAKNLARPGATQKPTPLTNENATAFGDALAQNKKAKTKKKTVIDPTAEPTSAEAAAALAIEPEIVSEDTTKGSLKYQPSQYGPGGHG